MRRVLSLVMAVAVLGAAFAASAEAGERGRRGRQVVVRQDVRGDRYFRDRDVVVIREYYRPSYRALPPGLQRQYLRSGRLPRGWERRMRPVPVFIERDMMRVPRGYSRGIIDGRAVIYDRRGFILDVAVLF